MQHNIHPSLIDFATEIEILRLDPTNARTEHDIKGIAQAFTDYGQRQVIVVNKSEDNKVEAGNGRLMAARSLGWTHIAAIFVEDDPLTAIGFAIADNRLTDKSKFDEYVLAQLVKKMREGDRLVIGYDQDVLDQLVADYTGDHGDGMIDGGPGGEFNDGRGDEMPENPADELLEKWGAEAGQVWRLGSAHGGEHRIICGDCNDPAVRDQLLELDRVELCITDPPYGINVDTSWMDRVKGRKGKNLSNDKLIGDHGIVNIEAVFLFEKWIVWGFPHLYTDEASGWLVWDKWPGLQSTEMDFHASPIEMAMSNCWQGFKMVRLMWAGYYKAAGEEKRVPHPTQKPIGVFRPYIEKYTKPGEIIADLFSGSGTAINASEKSGRFCRACEIDPRYVAVTLERYENTFGIEGELL